VTGTAVRPTYLRSKEAAGSAERGYLFTDNDGKAAGYLFDGPPVRGELYCHTDSAGDALERLKILAMLARRHGCEGVHFHRLPFASDLAAQLRRLSCDLDVHYRNDGGYMIRIIDLETTLTAMAGELSRRLERSHLSGWRGELLVRAEGQQVTLTIDRATVRVGSGKATPHQVEGGPHVAQLLVGTFAPRETAQAGGIALSGEAGELVEVLFPHQWPQMPNEDL
jgi:hypothetical protein